MAIPTITLQQAAKDALAVQDACNLSGVVRSWATAMSVIPGDSTGERNTHPIAQLFAYQAAFLAHGREPWQSFESDQYSEAVAACRRIAEEEA